MCPLFRFVDVVPVEEDLEIPVVHPVAVRFWYVQKQMHILNENFNVKDDACPPATLLRRIAAICPPTAGFSLWRE